MEPTATAIFSYQAQTDEGLRLSGTIDATDAESAMERLQALRLRVVELSPAAPVRGKAIRGDAFLAFNQQLAQLTAAGLPVEQGLRLIAGDVRSGRLARTIRQVAEELERGTPLDQAFDKYRAQFPPLYGRLIAAGVKSGDLPGVLLNLGRHLELVQRLRAAVWRALSYPLMVLIGTAIVLLFLSRVVLPEFASIYASFKMPLPPVTELLMGIAGAAPVILAIILVIVVGVPLAWQVLRSTGREGGIVERLVMPLPLVGPVLRFALVARWCDAARLAVSAGLDLPAAIELAADATGSKGLAADGREMISLLSSGQPLTACRCRLLPATVPAAVQFASAHHDLATTLETLAEMYHRQAELRLNAVPAVLTPVTLVVLAAVIGFIIIALFMPLVAFISSLSGNKL